MRISQKVKDVTMRNLGNTIFYKQTNVLQDFHICINVPLNLKTDVLMLIVYIKNSRNL